MYAKGQDTDEILSLGLLPEDFLPAEEALAVWPENRESVQVFIAMRHQWRVGGMGSCTGMDFGQLDRFLSALRIRRRNHKRVFMDLLILEDAALAEIHKPDENKSKGR